MKKNTRKSRKSKKSKKNTKLTLWKKIKKDLLKKVIVGMSLLGLIFAGLPIDKIIN